jgi:hypothetical protein
VRAFNAVEKYRHFGETCYPRLRARGENRVDISRGGRGKGSELTSKREPVVLKMATLKGKISRGIF